MALEFFRRAAGTPGRLGILPGSFNPPTVAHVALARAALSKVDEVLLVLPRAFPHKQYEGAAFEDRVGLLETALEAEPECSIGASAGGLFIEIAREAREAYGQETRLSFLCGRDAAERIVGWDYGRPGAIDEMLREFDLLVAARGGEYVPPARFAPCVETLAIGAGCDEVSATEVRRSVAAGVPWEHLVPRATVPQVQRLYARG